MCHRINIFAPEIPETLATFGVEHELSKPIGQRLGVRVDDRALRDRRMLPESPGSQPRLEITAAPLAIALDSEQAVADEELLRNDVRIRSASRTS